MSEEKSPSFSKKNKNVLISTIGVVGVVLVVSVLALGGKKSGSQQNSLPVEVRGASIEAPPTPVAPDRDLTPKYQEMMNKVNREVVEKNEAAGRSGIERQNPVKLEEATKTSSGVAGADQRPQTQSVALQQTQQLHLPQQVHQAPPNQMVGPAISALVSKWTPGTHHTIVYPESAQQITQGSVASTAGSGVQAQTSAAAQKQAAVMRAGDIHAITFTGMLNSDYPGPVVAVLRTGPMAGSKIIGKMSRNKYRLAVSFNTLVPNDGGASIKIEAVVMDAVDQLPGTSTSVDKKIMERYVLRPFAVFVSGMGQAVAASSTSTTMNPTGVQSTTNIDSEGQAKIALGKVAEEFSKDLTGSSVEPTVMVDPKDPNSAAGVLFVADVYRVVAGEANQLAPNNRGLADNSPSLQQTKNR